MIEIKIAFFDAGIRPQTSELSPAGKHAFLGEPPIYLHEKLEYPYRAMVVFWQNRPTGGTSVNPITQRLYYKRLHKQLGQLLEATQWLERMVKAWRSHSLDKAPKLIAQAEDLLWYMEKEPLDKELNAIFDGVRAVTPGMVCDQLWLLNWGADLLTYVDSLRQRSLRRISDDERFVITVRGDNATFLMEIIARRLDTSVRDLTDKLRCIVSGLEPYGSE